MDCVACPLSESRNQIVWGQGPKPAPVMLLGDMPGYYDDLSGQPFSGRMESTLYSLLSNSSLEDQTYRTLMVKCRPDDRKPLPREIESCQRWLTEELIAVTPLVLVVAGRSAASVVLPWTDRIPVGQWTVQTFLGWSGLVVGVTSLGATMMDKTGTLATESLTVLRDVARLVEEIQHDNAASGQGGV